jgi:hypothetical protein
MDEPATAQALAGTVLRGVLCGAVDAAEVEQRTGVPQARLEALVRRTAP